MSRGVEPVLSRADGASSDAEARAAVLIAAALYVVGATLTGTAALLPDVSWPVGVIAIAATAMVTAAVLLVAVRLGRAGLKLAYAADLWGVLLVALLCADTGGAHSPFALIYFFAVGHAAAFQPRRRLIVVSAAGLAGFLAPLLYGHVSARFGAAACVGMVLALLTCGVVHFALNRARDQRALLEFLLAATSSLDSSLDPAATLRLVAHTAVPQLADLCVIELVDPDGTSLETVAAGRDRDLATRAERLRAAARPDVGGAHPVGTVLKTGKPCIVDDLAARSGTGAEAQEEYRRFMRAVGVGSAAVFPMIARGRTHGAISFMHATVRPRYKPSQLTVLEDLTGRAALAYDNARLYADRARVAGTLRRSLMPAGLPEIPGVELASFFRPMGAGDEVGGDFFDVFRDDDGCWLVVGDVCGKGAEAAVLTGFLRHTTMAYARETTSPASVLAQVNQAMLEQDFGGRFATALLAHLRSGESAVEVRIATAGHPAALLSRAMGNAGELGDCGTLLGVFSDPVIKDASTLLEPGDLLALYTDGLSEAHAPERTVTVQQMAAQLQQSSQFRAQDAVDALLELVDLDARLRDDIAILVARVRTPAQPELSYRQGPTLRASR